MVKPGRHRGGFGDAPIEPKYRAMMRQVANYLDRKFNGRTRGADRRTGFVLLVFDFNEPAGRANYISNGADRRDIIRFFEDQIERFKDDPEIKP